MKNKELNKIKDDENFIYNKFGYCYYVWDKINPAIIYNLFIYQEFRHKGNARKILQLVINEIRLLGYEGNINIEAKPKEKFIDKKQLIKFYEKMGLNVINK
jgi:GNAT superfamily N-acetyltransferase